MKTRLVFQVHVQDTSITCQIIIKKRKSKITYTNLPVIIFHLPISFPRTLEQYRFIKPWPNVTLA